MHAVARERVSVRPKQVSDDAFIAELARDAFAEYSNDAAPYTVSITYAQGNRAFIALKGDRPVGLVVLQVIEPRRGCVLAIAVAPAERGRGVGYQLMMAVESVAARRGLEALVLFTAEDNVAALDLFFRRGFVIRRRIQRFYAPGQNACELEKTL